ncbi:hypothetical protein KHC23_07800 [Ancylobacter dichloromethanicus]|uniref:Uncharacterized protein n=1 Tax=Ancylobacter dichloromethanicus TaxID=518825 RepID=A0A9W6MZD6_9HYPH|nr:hypothetical protein [Ancylobacter dichloromethanicus]MBS7553550.1 hypothetical protein [Ancylobacter dichloromethanicus]GLK72609.1 hypothetical protein GCM10017643_27250 [Ancylobacter dichloromethanicus]
MAYDASKDPYSHIAGTSITAPGRKLVTITPADAELATYCKQLWCFCPPDVAGGVGTVRLVATGNADNEPEDVMVTPGLQPLPPVQVRRVMATGTTAGLTIYGISDV